MTSGDIDFDPFGIQLRVTVERLFDARFDIFGLQARFDLQAVGHAFDPDHVVNGLVRLSALELPIDFTLERHPGVFNFDVDAFLGDDPIRVERLEYRLCDVGVGSKMARADVDFDFVGNSTNSHHVFSGIDRRELFDQGFDNSVQSHDTILGGHANVCRVDPRIGVEFGENVLFNFQILFHS